MAVAQTSVDAFQSTIPLQTAGPSTFTYKARSCHPTGHQEAQHRNQVKQHYTIFLILSHIRQELSLSKSKSHECELSGGSREEMLMGELGPLTSTTGTERVDSSGYSSASEAPSATRKRLHSSEPEAGEAAHSPIASPLSPPVPPSDRMKVQNSLTISGRD